MGEAGTLAARREMFKLRSRAGGLIEGVHLVRFLRRWIAPQDTHVRIQSFELAQGSMQVRLIGIPFDVDEKEVFPGTFARWA